MTRWAEVSPGGQAYADHFARLAAAGQPMHGEADLLEALLTPGARVLDAGCGTGRVAVELRRRGFAVEGVDADPAMLAVARAADREISWHERDLARLATVAPGPYALVVAAGNVMPLVADLPAVLAGLRDRLVRGGLLVAGFGLDAAHLPVPPTLDLATYDRQCADAGLALADRWATWDQEPFTDAAGYAVTVSLRS